MIISCVIIDLHRSKNWHMKSTNAPVNQYLKISFVKNIYSEHATRHTNIDVIRISYKKL